ncbi:hypothetical protein CDL15_Pgr003067 [Punica granatum]|uniref:Uncharacterized protein n=1 Tax=Punica granatum TaxID=22663 RepID=A0A218X2G5_PUNGR|nr:hypothetical protein CDL15_Pgr003067 [Punica granatum]
MEWLSRDEDDIDLRRVLGLGTVTAFGVRAEIACLSPLQLLCDRCSSSKRFYDVDAHFCVKHRGLSSQITAERSRDNEPENAPAELELPASSDTINRSNIEDGMKELFTVEKLSDDDDDDDDVNASQDELKLSDIDTDPKERKPLREKDTALFKAIVSAP